MSYPWGERQNVKPKFDVITLPVSTALGGKEIQFVLMVKTPS